MSHLKKIDVADLRLGMYLHGFDESWMKNPFWKSKFLLRDYADLQVAWTCGIETCWIDLSKGRDVTVRAPELEYEAPVLTQDPESATFDEELERAAILCKSARTATLSSNSARAALPSSSNRTRRC